MITEPDVFWARVTKSDDCWEWTGARTSAGYGHFRITGGGYEYAHRFAYLISTGPIPEGLVLDHLCRNPPCVRPDHLEAVTHAENVRRGLRPYWAIRTECVHGHDITNPANVYTAPAGDNRCRVCAKITQAAKRKPNWPPTYCPQGHEFTPENTARYGSGRSCKQCNRDKSQRVHAKKKAATS